MDSCAQASVEYILLVAGAVLLTIIVGYYLVSAALSAVAEVNTVSHG